MQKNSTSLIIIFYLNIFNYNVAYSQTNNNSIWNIFFDELVGQENLPLANGLVYNDFYNTKKNENCFLKSNNFEVEKLNYENQIYSNIKINYDIYKDNIIIETIFQKNKTKIIVNRQKVLSFELDGSKFENLELLLQKVPENIKGFYELVYKATEYNVYVKHQKKMRKVIEDQIYNEFDYYIDFFILKNNVFYEINSKKQLLKLFEIYKNDIDKYYIINSKIEKSDKKLFINNLIRLIENLK